MPVPMQIYAEVDNALPCPLTVREGRNWVTQLMEEARCPTEKISIINENENEKKTQNDSREKEIEVHDVWFRYEKDGADVVQDLSLTVYNGEFFAGNNFYTTAANRMVRHYFPEAVTAKEVAACLKEKL